MKKEKLPILSLVILFASLAGCAGLPGFEALPSKILSPCSPDLMRNGEPSGGIGVYLKDRCNDFADIFSLSLSTGVGVLLNARATQAIQAGGFFFGGARLGFIGRHAGGWSEEVFEMGIPGFYARSVKIIPSGDFMERMNTERGQALWIFAGDEGVSYNTGYDRKFWQVGLTAHALFLGLDFSVNLKELLDFILGWTTLDISRDDTSNQARRKEE